MPDIKFIIAITLAVIFLIVIITHKTDKQRRVASRKHIQQSAGTYDREAAIALDNLNKIESPTPTDNYLAAQIIELNTFEGNLDSVNDVTTVAKKYTNVLNAIEQQRQNITEATNNQINNTLDLPQLHMIDHIGDFAERQIQQLLFDQFAPAIADDLNVIAAQAHSANTAIINNAANKAALTAKNKAEYAGNVTAMLITNTSDPQNVHDAGVRNDNINTLQVLKQSESKIPAHVILKEIEQYIKSCSLGAETKRKATNMLPHFASQTAVSVYGDTDTHILKQVWDRAHVSANSANKTNICDSIVEAIAACDKNGSSVCVNGRVSNIIGSLATLDVNQTVGAALTTEQYKNEILRSCMNIFDAEITNATNDPDAKMRAVGMSYNNSSIRTDPETEEIFKDRLKEKIRDLINSYSSSLTERVRDELTIACHTACAL